MSQTQTITNGDHGSKVISHLKTYPVVADGIETFKSNPLGAKSLEIVDATYNTFGKPLEPHLRTPASYAAPYLNKADKLGDDALAKIENKFPIVKEDTKDVVGIVQSYAFWPFKLANSGKDYLLGAWSEEYNKTVSERGGLGPISLSMAGFHFGLRVTSDGLLAASEFLGPKKEEAKDKAAQLSEAAKQKKDTYAQKVQEGT